MTLYSVFEKPAVPSAAPAVVPDRFSWLAAVLPPVYLLWHGLWLELLVWCLVMGGLTGVAIWLGPDLALLAYLLFAWLLGLEAAALRRAGLRRRGWQHGGELVAAAPDLAEVAWLERRSPK